MNWGDRDEVRAEQDRLAEEEFVAAREAWLRAGEDEDRARAEQDDDR